MTGLMAGKRGLIMGLANDKSLAWGIAKQLHAQGAELAFSYQGDALAKRVRPLAEQVGSDFLIDCDVTDMDKLDAAFAQVSKVRPFCINPWITWFNRCSLIAPGSWSISFLNS